MKELYFLDSCYNATSAGTNRILAFALALQRKGVKVTIFYLFPYTNREKCERYNDILNFVYLWEDSPVSNKYFNTIRSMWIFYKLMTPEIPVYVYSLLNCLYFLRKKKGISLYHEYTENPEVIGKIGGFLGNYLYKKYKQSIPNLNGLFLITPALCNMYVNEFGANQDKTVLLNMIVDTKRFEEQTEVPITNTITYCGIISEYKDGVSVLIKAFAKVVAKHPDYILKVVGKFRDDTVKRNLYNLVEELNLIGKVIFVGSVHPQEMPTLLKSSKILALARPDNIQARYGFATKIGEYLMSERPIVLTRVGSFENYLKDKENCIFALPDNIDDFADKLIWAIDNYDTASQIGIRGKEVALAHFNSEIESNKIYDLIFK